MRKIGLLVLLSAPFGARPALAQEVCFPPFGCDERMMKDLRAAKGSVDVAMYFFTDGRYADVLDEIQARGVAVRVVVDIDCARTGNCVPVKCENGSAKTCKGKFVSARKFPAWVWQQGQLVRKGNETFHHKFVVIDEKVVWVGSMNWTRQAAAQNLESMVRLTGPAAKEYAERFELIWDTNYGCEH